VYSVFIFGGTTEARYLSSYLIDQGISCTVTVTSNYAKELLTKSPLLDVRVKRLNVDEMKAAITEINPSLIVDATHPYAFEVSQNIKKACNNLNKEYLTVSRDIGSIDGTKTFKSMEMLASFLSDNCTTDEMALSTLGIKEAKCLCDNFKNYKESIYLRILPSMESLSRAKELDFPSKHIMCMQGPFSKEMNVALLHETGSKYLLTKITGKVGGLEAKIEAAKECGAEVLALIAPDREKGLTLDDAKLQINRDFKKFNKKEVSNCER
jgi:precorrin-6x reductase